MQKKKYYLITSLSKLNYKKGSNLLFLDHYIYKYYPKEKLKKYNSFVSNSLNSVFKHKSKEQDFEKKRVSVYRKQLSNILNKIHKTSFSESYWGIILDFWLYTIISVTKYKYNFIKKTKKNFSNVWCKKVKFSKIYFDTKSFRKDVHINHKLHQYISFIVAQKVGIGIINKNNFNRSNKEKFFKDEISLKSFFTNLINYFFRLYIIFIKPTLIIDGYFGIKNSIKIFLRSYGKILFLTSDLFFFKKNYDIRIDYNLRSLIRIKENDKFDEIFNSLILQLLPISYLEGFDQFQKENKYLSNVIPNIGSAIGHTNDKFKFLTANMLQNNKKNFYTFQHGGGTYGVRQNFILENIEKSHSSKMYLWNNENGR